MLQDLRKLHPFRGLSGRCHAHFPDIAISTPAEGGGGEGVLPYMGYIGMCRCEGYGFQAGYFSIGYINQSVWV